MKKLLSLAALVSAGVLLSAGTASSALVEPITVVGNPSCEGGIVVEPVSSGTFGGVTISVYTTATGQEFDFSAAGLVQAVIVKGGPNANFYDYSALGGVSSDTGLHSPLNTKNGRWYGLSHLCVFFEKKTPPPPPPKK